VPLVAPRGPAGSGPRRRVLLPFTESAFESLRGEELAWWQAQGDRRDLMIFEAVNFMDGRRTTAEIAEALACEFETEVDAAWVERVVALFGRLQLIEARAP
ncbi:MAG TPA: hypothetical protein VJS92_06100, partial [Candidatus Polarisedimenticolaceae bacterium]|nr:hypothetical protein [Candidatus Polarisedimenticolaceae bacterium]